MTTQPQEDAMLRKMFITTALVSFAATAASADETLLS
jgi:hypothetical protein